MTRMAIIRPTTGDRCRSERRAVDDTTVIQQGARALRANGEGLRQLFRLDGRRAVVVGAGSGIGRESAPSRWPPMAPQVVVRRP